MLKQGIKKYFRSLNYVFTPLGTMFLGMMIGFSILIPGMLSSANSLIDGVKALSDSVNLDFRTLFQDVWTCVRTLNWDAPFGAFRTLFSSGWWHDTLTQVLNSILGTDYETFTEQIVGLIGTFTSSVVKYVAIFFALWALGFVAGFFIVKFQIRRNTVKRAVWKEILAALAHAVFMTVLVAAALMLLSMWSPSIIFSTLVMIVLMSMYSLTEAYCIHGRKKVPFGQVVNAKSAGLYVLTCFLIFLISAAFTAVACLINVLMGLFVGLAVVEVAIIVIYLNAEIYVKSVVGD